ncbi:MAG TPA: pilin [Candidatus Paceibacterota bacterium]
MKKILAAVGVWALPALVFAQPIVDAESLFVRIKNLANQIIPIIITLTVLVIIWGIFMMVLAGGEDKKAKAKDIILWGTVGLFVMLSIWGLVNFLGRTLNLDTRIPTEKINNLLPR